MQKDKSPVARSVAVTCSHQVRARGLLSAFGKRPSSGRCAQLGVAAVLNEQWPRASELMEFVLTAVRTAPLTTAEGGSYGR